MSRMDHLRSRPADERHGHGSVGRHGRGMGRITNRHLWISRGYAQWAALLAASTVLCLNGPAHGVKDKNAVPVAILPPGHWTEEADDLRRALEYHVGDLPVRVEARPATPATEGPPADSDLLARARAACADDDCLAAVSWTDLADGRSLLHLVDPYGGRVLTREIPAEEREARFETMALICRSTLSVLLKGGRIGVEPAPPAPLSSPAEKTQQARPDQSAGAPPVDETTARPAPPLAFELGYRLASRSGEVPLMHGLGLNLEVHPRSWFSLRAGYTFFAPADISGREAEIRLARHPVSLGADLLVPIGASRWHAGLGLGLLVDVVTQHTRRLSDQDVRPNDNRDTALGITLSIPLSYRLLDAVSLALRFSLDCMVRSHGYKYHYRPSPQPEGVPADEVYERLESPWRLQPGLFIGLSLHPPKEKSAIRSRLPRYTEDE